MAVSSSTISDLWHRVSLKRGAALPPPFFRDIATSLLCHNLVADRYIAKGEKRENPLSISNQIRIFAKILRMR